jgi:hypothetical protein
LRQDRHTSISEINGLPHKLHFCPCTAAACALHCEQSPYLISATSISAVSHKAQYEGKTRFFAQRRNLIKKFMPIYMIADVFCITENEKIFYMVSGTIKKAEKIRCLTPFFLIK